MAFIARETGSSAADAAGDCAFAVPAIETRISSPLKAPVTGRLQSPIADLSVMDSDSRIIVTLPLGRGCQLRKLGFHSSYAGATPTVLDFEVPLPNRVDRRI